MVTCFGANLKIESCVYLSHEIRSLLYCDLSLLWQVRFCPKKEDDYFFMSMLSNLSDPVL